MKSKEEVAEILNSIMENQDMGFKEKVEKGFNLLFEENFLPNRPAEVYGAFPRALFKEQKRTPEASEYRVRLIFSLGKRPSIHQEKLRGEACAVDGARHSLISLDHGLATLAYAKSTIRVDGGYSLKETLYRAKEELHNAGAPTEGRWIVLHYSHYGDLMMAEENSKLFDDPRNRFESCSQGTICGTLLGFNVFLSSHIKTSPDDFHQNIFGVTNGSNSSLIYGLDKREVNLINNSGLEKIQLEIPYWVENQPAKYLGIINTIKS